MATLPQELVNEILLSLPVKPLRFKCVSKSFSAIIGSQYFINSHFKRCSENRIHHKLIDLRVHRMNKCMQVHASDSNDVFEQELVLDKYHPTMLCYVFFSSCNGLVLLSILPDKLSIWNPSTRKYRILPDFPVTGWLHFGLGYDSSADDYKVVLIGRTKQCDMYQVWIFELRSSCWRKIQDFPYAGYKISEHGGNGDCFVDGASHFICYTKDYKSYIIVAFDVAKETFSVVSEPFRPTEGIASHLHVFGGCLSLSIRNLCLPRQCDIYVRKKDEAEFTWTRLYSVTGKEFSGGEFDCFVSGSFAYSREGDKVLLSTSWKLCSYDLKEKSIQEIVIKKKDINSNIFSCTESLASVGSQDEEE